MCWGKGPTVRSSRRPNYEPKYYDDDFEISFEKCCMGDLMAEEKYNCFPFTEDLATANVEVAACCGTGILMRTSRTNYNKYLV